MNQAGKGDTWEFGLGFDEVLAGVDAGLDGGVGDWLVRPVQAGITSTASRTSQVRFIVMTVPARRSPASEPGSATGRLTQEPPHLAAQVAAT